MKSWIKNSIDVVGTKEEILWFAKIVSGITPDYSLLTSDTLGYKSFSPVWSEFCFDTILPVPRSFLKDEYSHYLTYWKSTYWGTQTEAVDIKLWYGALDYNISSIHYEFVTENIPVGIMFTLSEQVEMKNSSLKFRWGILDEVVEQNNIIEAYEYGGFNEDGILVVNNPYTYFYSHKYEHLKELLIHEIEYQMTYFVKGDYREEIMSYNPFPTLHRLV